MRNRIKNFLADESGMEMVEWTIVATVFAVAAAAFWGQLGSAIDNALQSVVTMINSGASSGT